VHGPLVQFVELAASCLGKTFAGKACVMNSAKPNHNVINWEKEMESQPDGLPKCDSERGGFIVNGTGLPAAVGADEAGCICQHAIANQENK
jgi:hypothetical protein